MAADLSGFIWFRGDVTTGPVYVYNPITGTKRHVRKPESNLLRATQGGTQYPVTKIAQADADAIPLAE